MPKPKRPPRPVVEVRDADCEPMDLDRFAGRLVEILFEVEGLRPSVATPPIASVG